MTDKFTNELKDIIRFSRLEAIALGYDYIGPEHLLLGMLHKDATNCSAVYALGNLSVKPKELREAIINAIGGNRPQKEFKVEALPLTIQAEKAIKISHSEARLWKSNSINSFHLLLSILRDKKNVVSSVLVFYKLNYEVLFRLSKPYYQDIAALEHHQSVGIGNGLLQSPWLRQLKRIFG